MTPHLSPLRLSKGKRQSTTRQIALTITEHYRAYCRLKHLIREATFFPVIESMPEFEVAPLDPLRLFGRDAPLQVDLGCGDGSFLCEMAEQFPDKNFLGIERLTKQVEKVRRKAEKIDNV